MDNSFTDEFVDSIFIIKFSEPKVGFEPTTFNSQNYFSAVELFGQNYLKDRVKILINYCKLKSSDGIPTLLPQEDVFPL